MSVFSSRLKYIEVRLLLCFAIGGASFPVYAAEKACLVQAKYLKETGANTFVDVRNKTFFEIKNIPGSLNIALNIIKTKSFLKNKNVILLGNGWNEPALIEECMQLKSKGFKSIKVLSGGIITLFNTKATHQKRSLVTLTSKEFFNTSEEKKFVPFVISDKDKEFKMNLPHARVYTSKTAKKALLRDMVKLGKGKNPIVIFGEIHPVIDSVLNDYIKKGLRKVFYYMDGYADYNRMNNLHKITSLSNQRQRLSTKKPVSCAF